MRSLPMLKCSSERCVCAPHSLSLSTLTAPKLSCSTRVVAIVSYPCNCADQEGQRRGAVARRDDAQERCHHNAFRLSSRRSDAKNGLPIVPCAVAGAEDQAA